MVSAQEETFVRWTCRVQREAHAKGTVTNGQSREGSKVRLVNSKRGHEWRVKNGQNANGQSTTEGQMANGQNDQEKLEQSNGAATGRGGESAASSHEGGRG